MARKADSSIDYTSKDYEAFRNDMIVKLQEKIPEYTDTRESDAGIVIIELLAMGLDILSFYQDVYANEVYLTTASQKDNILKWCSMLGYTPRNSSCAKFKQVFELVGKQETDTVIPKGTIIQTKQTRGEEILTFETMEDLVIPAGNLGNEKELNGNYKYVVDVYEGKSISGEVIGSSKGTPSQKFDLFFDNPILDNTFKCYVYNGYSNEEWVKVNSFVESMPTSKHYVVTESHSTISIVFGDGVFGAIPTVGEDNIFVDYRVGGGDAGNVGKNTINNIVSRMAVIKGTFNPYEAYEKGMEEESIEDIKVNAPIANRTLWGAITLADFADVLVSNYDFVVDAESQRDLGNPDNIHIYVLLKNNAELTEEIKNQLLDFFNENVGGRKVIGSDTIYIHPPTMKGLNIKARLIVKDTYNQDLVRHNVEEYITNYFAEGTYGFAKEFSYTGFANEIFNSIDGVKAFTFIHYVSDEEILTPNVGEIYYMSTLDIVASGGVL